MNFFKKILFGIFFFLNFENFQARPICDHGEETNSNSFCASLGPIEDQNELENHILENLVKNSDSSEIFHRIEKINATLV